jgi:hypothetical protein
VKATCLCIFAIIFVLLILSVGLSALPSSYSKSIVKDVVAKGEHLYFHAHRQRLRKQASPRNHAARNKNPIFILSLTDDNGEKLELRCVWLPMLFLYPMMIRITVTLFFLLETPVQSVCLKVILQLTFIFHSIIRK